MHCCEKYVCFIILISLLMFNISFWIDIWSTSENGSQGIWDLCLQSHGRSCCQSFSDRGEEIPDWFYNFRNALYAACFFTALTVVIWPYRTCVDEKDNTESVVIDLLTVGCCFSSAICLIIALHVYGYNFKSVGSLTDHDLHASFWIAVVCVILYSFAGIVMTVPIIYTIKMRCRKDFYCCCVRCNNVPQAATGAKKEGSGRRKDDNVPNMQIDNTSRRRYIYSKIEESFLKNNNGFQIIEILKIQNSEIYDAHISFGTQSMKRAKEQHPHSYRKYLWHGTSRASTEIIDKKGFNRNYQDNNGCLYGDGVYFATEPSHASNDSLSVPDNSGVKYVYQCSVFVGTYCAGIKDMQEPPSCKQGFRYDSTVDNVNNPKIYVIYFDHQAFPKYLIKFKRSEVICSRPANNIQSLHPVLGPRPGNNIQPPSNPGNVVSGPRPGNNIQPPHPGNVVSGPRPGNNVQPPQPGNVVSGPSSGNNIQPPHPGNVVSGPRPGNNIQPPHPGNLDICPKPENYIQPPHTGFKDKWEHTDRGDLQIVELKKDSCEYKEIETSFLQNNTGYQTIKISRIQNSQQYAAHMSFGNEFMKVAAKQHPRSYMKYLWHGTSESSTDNINKYGFNRNYKGKNACAYGEGVYFATDPSYSSQDRYSVPDERHVKRVYLCSVFVGRYIKGEKCIKEPPKDKDNVRYDSTVDDLNNPKIHVVFRDYQSYTQYLIEFKSI